MLRAHSLPLSFALFLSVGCSSNTDRVSAGSGGDTSGGAVSTGGTTISCPAGSERCACYGNGTCNSNLECRSSLCVSSVVSNGGAGVGGSDGTTSAAGNASTGGSAASGGSNVLGGTSSVGGTSEVGASGTSTGGATVAGGAAATGGANLGGLSSAGGTNALGGVTSAGGTSGTVIGSATGGNLSVGGSLGSGGTQSASGGASSAGQPSTGGSTSTQICGNGIVEGSEGCDPLPKNNDWGDGCTPDCMIEPNCPAGGGPCTSTCGDGLVLGDEACDDGNTVSGDGCSAACTVENGFQCAQPPLGETMVVPMVVRDFNVGGDFEKGSSFATALNYANQGLIQSTLAADGQKPVLASTTGTYNGASGQASGIASAASFAQWYNDAAPASGNTYHATVVSALPLYLVANSDPPTYVNRFGNNGDGLTSAQYVRTHTNQCGTLTQSNHDTAGNALPCTACYLNLDDPANLTPCPQNDTTFCQTDPTYTGQCVASGNAWVGTFLDAAFDGNPLFFPADAVEKPWSPSTTAQIAGNYNPSWPIDPGGSTHNFSFTTEVRFWFRYDSSQTYKLSILGDDDIWLFINKKLALDMGGIHTPVSGDVTLASGTGVVTATVSTTNVTPAPTPITTHPDLGELQNGNVYEIAVFQAERQTKASSYKISLFGFNNARSVCHSN